MVACVITGLFVDKALIVAGGIFAFLYVGTLLIHFGGD
jgi:hypothetical protein